MRKAAFLAFTGWLLAAPAHAELNWVAAEDGFVPRNAVVAGSESSGERLYVCRAAHNGGFHPGKVRAAFKACYFAAGGTEHAAPSYEVLVGGPAVWVPAQDGTVPPNAVPGGREGSGERLFICRAQFEGGTHSGKLRPAFRGCNISYGRKEHTVHQYQVLATPPANPTNPDTALKLSDCACLHNKTGRWLPFEYAWGSSKLRDWFIAPDQSVAVCQDVTAGTQFPELKVRIDRSNTGGAEAFSDYAIKSFVSPQKSCSAVPAQGHYNVESQPGTNNQFIRIAQQATQATAPSTPAPHPENTFGCACVNNDVGAPVQIRYQWGNDPFKMETLQPGNVFSFCWRYGTGAHASPPLHFMLNRATDGSAAFTTYALPRVQSPTTQCAAVPKSGQYHIRFQPGTNDQFLHVTK